MRELIFTIDTSLGLSEEGFQMQLEELGKAAHALLVRGLLMGKTCNHPDITVLQQGCGFLEIAAHNGRVFLQQKGSESSAAKADIVLPKVM